MAAAREALQAANAIHRGTGTVPQEAITLGNCGNRWRARSDLDAPAATLDRTRSLMAQTGSRRNEAYVTATLGELNPDRGHLDTARAHFEQAPAIHHGPRNGDDPLALARLLCPKGRAAASAGEPANARAALDEDRAMAAAPVIDAVSQLGRDIVALEVS